ncbi:hypothetical protein H8S37_16715 [Mediterraneibacter sp. NSJ-55]|uniref:Uncharacterized protein n=1 Tax=Mediterraneibacter hominis TaxID=2763054 RepID=A0A923RTS5_9FIRM|nr:hypothetical protein [Mediterraneibacter hominis]MBC5690557.1 hypothetical protein [Mediterraneibacter hominis]
MDNVEKLLRRTEKEDFVLQKSQGAYSNKKLLLGEICKSLSQDTALYKPEQTIALLRQYITEEERFLYSELSNYIYSLGNDGTGTFITNLESLAESVEQIDEKQENVDIRNITFKLYDHCQLAIAQSRNLLKDKVDFQKMITDNLSDVYDDFDKRVDRAKRDINTQLVSLVGIFTALAFLIFGSINSLDNIFQSLQSLSILKLMMTGCIWGIGVLNLIFIFLYFVAKITGTEIKTNLSRDANFIQRYPFTCWSNLILITILGICGWCYYIDSSNIGSWFIELSNTYQILICIGGFVIIGLIFLFTAGYIVYKCK